jgi:hypothetical protein
VIFPVFCGDYHEVFSGAFQNMMLQSWCINSNVIGNAHNFKLIYGLKLAVLPVAGISPWCFT